MATMRKSTDRLDTLRRLAETYGADPARWPYGARADVAGILDTDEAARVLDEEESLDGFLNAASAPRMSADLQNRIMSGYAPSPAPRGLMDVLRGLAPGMRLLPAGALAGFGALGMATGLMSVSAQEPLSPEYEALAYVDDLAVAALNDDGELEWDAE